MKLLVRLYEEGNDFGMPTGFPAECKEVDDFFVEKNIPDGWILTTVVQLEQLKHPLKEEAKIAIDAITIKEQEKLKEDLSNTRIYIETPVSLTDGRKGRLYVDLSDIIRFEADE